MLEGFLDQSLELVVFHESTVVGIEHLDQLSTLSVGHLDTALGQDLLQFVAGDLTRLVGIECVEGSLDLSLGWFSWHVEIIF